jgi:anti-anti-sigma factor
MVTQTIDRERLVEEVGHGDHLCLAFDDDAEKRRVATRYTADGLIRGERVLYFADRSDPDTVREWLHAARIDVAGASARGQLRVVTADETYLAPGVFDPDTMVRRLRDEIGASLDAGYTGMRVTGEMDWALREVPGSERLREYETKVNEVFVGRPASAICHYDARLFGPDALAAFDDCHPRRVELTPLYSTSVLRIVPSFQEGQRTLRVSGSVDMQTADRLEEALRATRAWPGDVRIDMRDLEFIDLTGLRVLVRTADSLDDGRRLRVEHLPEMLCKVIHLAGLDRSPALVVTSSEEVMAR